MVGSLTLAQKDVYGLKPIAAPVVLSHRQRKKGDVMSKKLALKILSGFGAAGAICGTAAILVSPAFGVFVAVGICGGFLAAGNAQ